MKIFELEINNLRIQILAAKNDIISIKNSSFCESQVLTEIIFRYNFQFSIFILQESSKQCLIFSYFSAVFEKSVAPRIIVQSHPKRMLDSYRSKDN